MKDILHEKCPLLTYNDKSSSYDELLLKDNLVSVHHRNNQCLVTEMFQVKNHILTIPIEKFRVN